MVVVVSVMYSVLSMSKWSVGDIIFGFFKLFNWYFVEKVVDIIIGVFVEYKYELLFLLNKCGVFLFVNIV